MKKSIFLLSTIFIFSLFSLNAKPQENIHLSHQYMLKAKQEFSPDYISMLNQFKDKIYNYHTNEVKDHFENYFMTENYYHDELYNNASNSINLVNYPIPLKGYKLLSIYDKNGNPNFKLNDQMAESVWEKKKDKNGKDTWWIKVATWISNDFKNSYGNFKNGEFIKDDNFRQLMWRDNTGKKHDYSTYVTISGQLKKYFKDNPVDSEQKAYKEIGEVLGMPDNHTNRSFATMWVKPERLYTDITGFFRG
jgi:hypothetical protein